MGLAVLAYASDQFVIGASRVALIGRISPLTVGVLVIGFGTSAPELLVSSLAAAGDEAEIAVGNVVGSNLANLTLLLGIGAVITPIAVASLTVRREAPITLAAMVALTAGLQGGGLGRLEGALLITAMVVATVVVLRGSTTDPLGPETTDLVGEVPAGLGTEALRTILGLIGTLASAQSLLWGAVELADEAGLNAGFVGTSLVAVGTSLPELVTVVQSARRCDTDLVVGNLLGSNLFNCLVAGGVVGLIEPAPIDAPELTILAAGVGLGAATLALAMMITSSTVTRTEGIVLISVYALTLPLLA